VSAPTLVVVATADPAGQAEALRAALGLTLRGAAVEVVFVAAVAPLAPHAHRAVATLRLFGHLVADGPGAAATLADAVDRAGAVEVWT
jgi:hypothetical protein